jgi:hypothetical protein
MKMRLVYPYTVGDVSPNALRSTHNPDSVYLGRKPQRGNMGNHPEIVEGWCGTSSDSDVHSLGEFDLDEPADFDRLEERLGGESIVFDRASILEWFDEEIDDDDTSYLFPQDGKCESAAFTWDENSEEFYGLAVRDGWSIVAGSDSENDVECLNREEERALTDGDIIDRVEEILRAAGIDYDRQDHDTYSSSTNGRDWAYIAVRDADKPAAESAIRAATVVAMEDD